MPHHSGKVSSEGITRFVGFRIRVGIPLDIVFTCDMVLNDVWGMLYKTR